MNTDGGLQEDDQEDRPDDTVLEHGQDQSPEETERLKQMKKEAIKNEHKNIQTVKNAMSDAMKAQLESGGAVNANAKQVMQALEEYDNRRFGSGNAATDSEITKDMASKEVQHELSESTTNAKTEPGLTKSQAAQEYVESLEKAKAASGTNSRAQKGTSCAILCHAAKSAIK